MQKFTILGCGSSWGVPVIGCKCKVCISNTPYNKRNRSSALIQSNTTTILLDSGFDIRTQLLTFGIDRLDALILTHDHADHVCGLDELRVFHDLHGHKSLDLYTDHNTLSIITHRIDYLMKRKVFNPVGFDFESEHLIGDIKIQFFRQDHGSMDSLGIRIGNLVYTNDVIRYPEESKKYLYNADIMIIDCVDYKATNTHIGLPEVIEWKNEFKPKQMYLTNMSHDIDYFEIQSALPSDILPAHDGLVLNIPGT